MLHIGNNRSVPMRDIVAVLDVTTLRRSREAFALGDLANSLDSARSVIVLESGGKTTLCSSPVSSSALRLRSPF